MLIENKAECSSFIPLHGPDHLQVLVPFVFVQLRVLLQQVDSVLVFPRELHFAVSDLALANDLLVDSLEVAFQVAKAVEAIGAVVANVRLDVRVLENNKIVEIVAEGVTSQTNLLLVMFPKNFLVELLPAALVAALVRRRLMISHVQPQVLHAGVFLAACFAGDVLVAVDMLDVLLQVTVVEGCKGTVRHQRSTD